MKELLASIPWAEIIASLGGIIVVILTFLNSKLKSLLSHIKPNGGSSLADAINRIEKTVKEMNLWMEAGQHLTQKPIFKTDQYGKFIWINTAFSRLVGVGFEELRGGRWISVVLEEDASKVYSEWFECVNSGRKFDMEFRINNAVTNEVTKVRGRAFPITDQDKTLGYLGTWLTLESLEA